MLLVFVGLVSSSLPGRADSGFTQSAKLVGAGAVGNASLGSFQGSSVSLSADGKTAIVGGPRDSSYVGAAWVFTLSTNGWTQVGDKLVGAGAVRAPFDQQGYSVSLSADGKTALVGGPGDNSGAGAAWVFTLSTDGWMQVGEKLVGAGAVGAAQQGSSVSLSADGKTALVGGPTDNSAAGAAWVFTLSGNGWTQVGGKLVGAGAVGPAAQGFSVSLSADGKSAIVGGRDDNYSPGAFSAGAAWVFALSNNGWTQVGGKLIGSGAVGAAWQGYSVSLSADGKTAIVGGPNDSSGAGAAWVFALSTNGWTQVGDKLVGAGAVNGGAQGYSVSLSADGKTALVGGPGDNSNSGAAWVFTLSPNGWTQVGDKLVGTGVLGSYQVQGSSVSLSADGKTALVGGPGDNSGAGAAWAFIAVTPPCPPGDGWITVAGGVQCYELPPCPKACKYGCVLDNIPPAPIKFICKRPDGSIP